MACVLDPSYSFQWLVHDHNGSSDVKQRVKDTIIEAIVREAENLNVGTPATAAGANTGQMSAESRELQQTSSEQNQVSDEQLSVAVAVPEPVSKKARLFENYTRNKIAMASSVKSARILVQQYLEYAEELSLNRDQGAKVLWTKVKNNVEFTNMHILFEKIFCTPATSAPVERVFSCSGLLMRPHRARMGNKLLSELVYIKCNIK